MAATTVGLGWIEILLFLLGGSGLLGMPPGDRDPAFLKAAPQNSLLFIEWSARGSGQVDAPGIDGFAADPEIQMLLKAINAGLMPADDSAEEDDRQVAVRDFFRLAMLITAHPGCVFVTIDPPRAPNGLQFVPNPLEVLSRIHFSLVIDAEADSNAIIDAFNRVTRQEIPYQPKMHSFPGAAGQEMQIHQEGNRLLIGLGAETIARTLAGLRGEVPGLDTNPRFLAGWKRVSLERVGSLTWFDIRSTTEIAVSALGPAGAIAQPILKGLGIDAFDYLVTGAGVVDGTVIQRTFIATGGRTDGILLLAGGPPLKLDQLAHIPADSDFVLAGSLSPGHVVQGIRELIAKSHPLSVNIFDETIKELEAELQLSLANDVYPAFGSAWTAFSSPSEGGVAGSGLIVALEVRDPAKAQVLYDRLLQLVEQALAPQGAEFGGDVELKQQEFLGHAISYVNGTGLSYGVTPTAIPTFCLTRRHLLFAVHPQAMKAHLRHMGKQIPGFNRVAGKKMSLAKNELLLVGYLDGARSVQTLSGLVPFLGQTMAEISHTQGWTFDPFTIPSSAALVPYAGDVTLSLARDNTGLMVESRNPHLGLGMLAGFVLANDWFHTGYENYLQVQQLPQLPAGDGAGLGAAEGAVVPAAAVQPAAAQPAELKEKTGDAMTRRAAPILLKAVIPDNIQQFIPEDVFRRLSEPPSPEALKAREDRRKELEERRRDRLERRRPKLPAPPAPAP